jgi:hypothetical protein
MSASETSAEVYLLGQEDSDETQSLWSKLNDAGITPCIYESLVDCRWHEELRFCGCGIPEEMTVHIGNLLAAIRERSDSKYTIDHIEEIAGSEMAYWFAMYVLDAMGLTEHGGSVGGCWLTEKGKKLLEEINVEIASRRDS